MMKFLLMSATALVFAAPVVAQVAPPAPADQGHAEHQKHGAAGGDHSKHANCCGDANGNGRMDCCEGKEGARRPCCDTHAASGQARPDRPAQPD